MLWGRPLRSPRTKLFQKAMSKTGVQNSPVTQAGELTKVLRKASWIASEVFFRTLSRCCREDHDPNVKVRRASFLGNVHATILLLGCLCYRGSCRLRIYDHYRKHSSSLYNINRTVQHLTFVPDRFYLAHAYPNCIYQWFILFYYR